MKGREHAAAYRMQKLMEDFEKKNPNGELQVRQEIGD